MTLNSPAVVAAMLAIIIMTQLVPVPLANLTPVSAQPSPRVATNSPSSSPGSPCLTPSAADISPAQLQPGASNSSIPGHVVAAVRQGKANYKGKLIESQPIHLKLVFKIRNPDQFTRCLNSINDPQSANHGHFLNSTTLSPYLPTPGEKRSVVTFLTTHGFSVTDGASPLVLEIQTTVGSAERGLGVSLGYYRLSNHTFYATNNDPSLPTSFANLVTGIIGLDNYTTPMPLTTITSCVGPYCPQGVQVGYSLSPLISGGKNGAGQIVAVVGEPGDPNPQLAINTFDTEFNLPSITLNMQYPDGIPPLSSYQSDWASENAMDIEAVHSVAPGAGIVLLYSFDVVGAIDYVASHQLAKIVSNSWTFACDSGPCSDTELGSGSGSTFVSGVDTELQADAAQGLTILFASGDSGAKPDGSTFGTEFPASDPNVLAVGATNLYLSLCGGLICGPWSSESGASISGGGYSGFFSEPSWQTSSIGPVAGRAVPDVSMLGWIPDFWVYSSAINACNGGSSSGSIVGGWFPCSGTSLSTPLWAGFLAIALQLRSGTAFGNIDPLLYQIASSSDYSTSFHDITSCNISSCNGLPVGTGWDPVTGWGSPIANVLVADLSGITFYTNPTNFPGASSPGTITACGGIFTNGQIGGCPSSFSATANSPTSPPGWVFALWQWNGAVSSCTPSATSNPISCSVSGAPGSLTAIFGAQVSFATDPTSSSALINWPSCSGTGYGNGASFSFTNFGSGTACYVPSGYTVSSWSCTGGLSCSGSNDLTSVAFTGPGTITLSLKTGSLSTPVSTSLTASATPPTAGNSFMVSGSLTASGTGLAGKQIVLVFGWSTKIVTVTTKTDGSYTYTATAPASAGSYDVDAFFLGSYAGSPQYLPSKATATINTS